MANKTSQSIKKQSLWRLLKLLKPHQGRYFAGLSGRVFLSSFERLIIAYLLKVIVDAITAADKVRFMNIMIEWIINYAAILVVAPFVLYLWRSAIVLGTANIRDVVFRHIQRLPLGYHELHHSGDAMSILTNDVTTAEKAYQEDLFVIVEASVQFLSAIVYMFLLNWQLSILIILSGLFPLVSNALFAGPLRKVGQKIQDRLGGVSERMTDLLAGFQVIRSFSLVDWILARFGQANERVLESSLQRVKLESTLNAANDFGGNFLFFAPLVIGAYMAMTGKTTLGVYLGLIQLGNQVNYFVYSMGGVISRLQTSLAAADRVLGLLDEPLEPERLASTAGVEVHAPALSTGGDGEPMIDFDQVSFAYNGGDKILNDLSFEITKGQFIAFAGPSGGGKSTIFKLLLGCYPAKAGSITVDGISIGDYPLAELRDRLAYVPQDAYLFSGSILDNIRYGKPAASEEEIHRAAKAAFAHDFITEFPEGYDTLVGERGARLSGGQRQRIAIARALLKDAPILLLDEATSSLDSESEQIVQKALEVLMQGRTTLVIAHRFSTIVHADRIYVIDGGRVVEQGKHPELMSQQGVYANLYEMQFKLNREGEVEPAQPDFPAQPLLSTAGI